MSDTEKYKSFEDIQCLWMKCGAVDYRICSNNFVCENCSFEKKMLSGLNKKVNIGEEVENAFDSGHFTVSFSHPNYHFGCGLILKNFLGNNYYLGLEPYVAKFIDRNSLVRYGLEDNFVKRGEPILNISNGWGEVNVLSPFGFRFVERLDLKRIFSNGTQWFAVIEADKHEILGNAINENNYYDKLYKTKNYLKGYIKTSEVDGTTMYDGGTALEKWSDILGKKTYKNLMTRLFS